MGGRTGLAQGGVGLATKEAGSREARWARQGHRRDRTLGRNICCPQGWPGGHDHAVRTPGVRLGWEVRDFCVILRISGREGFVAADEKLF